MVCGQERPFVALYDYFQDRKVNGMANEGLDVSGGQHHWAKHKESPIVGIHSVSILSASDTLGDWGEGGQFSR